MTIDDIITVVATPRSVCCLVPSNNLLSNSLNRCNFLFTQFKIRLLRVGISHDAQRAQGDRDDPTETEFLSTYSIPLGQSSSKQFLPPATPFTEEEARNTTRRRPGSTIDCCRNLPDFAGLEPARREAKIDERRRSVSRTGGNE